MHNKLTPEMLERLLSEYPEALIGDASLPASALVAYPEGREALRELAEFTCYLKAILVPVHPRPGFVRDLKYTLTAAPVAEQSIGWTRNRSVRMAGAFAVSAGLWYVIWPRLVAWRSRGKSDISPSLSAPGIVDAAS